MRVLTGLIVLAALGAPALPAAAPPLKVLLVSGSAEYESDRTLAGFRQHLEERYQVRCETIQAQGFEKLPGLEALDRCEVALFFTRRLTIAGEDLERVKRYCEAGRPIVAVRTASHGFQNWLDMDRLVLGGNYRGHHGAGPTLEARVAAGREGHPVLEGVGTIRTRGSLYRTSPLLPDAEVLMAGSTPKAPEPEPVAWVRAHKGGRVFYTSLGAQSDFEHAGFRRLLANALFWTAGRAVERREPAPLPPPPSASQGRLRLRLQSRIEPWKGSGAWEEVALEREVGAAETAILICDLWDSHWCRGAAERCGKLAGKMAPVIQAARARGVQVIHAPSETMDFYADRPQRRRMAETPKVAPPKPIDIAEPALPIDDSDGGCDTEEKPWYKAWTRQDPQVEVAGEDGISDSGSEIYSFLVSRGIKNLLVMGVHTNMCVLGRPFGIRQMTRLGIRCVLVRDLTDAMYDPRDRPQVSHDEGTQLVVQHIEKYWCPSMTSADLLAGLR